jgi:uncharacterized protein YndB with AHSA1/START domain
MTRALELRVDLPCPPEAAFAAWTEAAEITRWWGEAGVYSTTGWSADLKPGGAWRADFEGEGGEGFSAEGRYLEVARPSRLVWTWRASWAPDDESTIDMSFERASPGTTCLVLRNHGFASAQDCDAAKEGWDQILGWLSAHLGGAGDQLR